MILNVFVACIVRISVLCDVWRPTLCRGKSLKFGTTWNPTKAWLFLFSELQSFNLTISCMFRLLITTYYKVSSNWFQNEWYLNALRVLYLNYCRGFRLWPIAKIINRIKESLPAYHISNLLCQLVYNIEHASGQ